MIYAEENDHVEVVEWLKTNVVDTIM